MICAIWAEDSDQRISELQNNLIFKVDRHNPILEEGFDQNDERR